MGITSVLNRAGQEASSTHRYTSRRQIEHLAMCFQGEYWPGVDKALRDFQPLFHKAL